jgi:hypothetical protein
MHQDFSPHGIRSAEIQNLNRQSFIGHDDSMRSLHPLPIRGTLHRLEHGFKIRAEIPRVWSCFLRQPHVVEYGKPGRNVLPAASSECALTPKGADRPSL